MRRTVALAAVLALVSPAAARPQIVAERYGLHRFPGFSLSEDLIALGKRLPPGPEFTLAAATRILQDSTIPPSARALVPDALGLIDQVRRWREFTEESKSLSPLRRVLGLYRMQRQGDPSRAFGSPRPPSHDGLTSEVSALLHALGIPVPDRLSALLRTMEVLPRPVPGALAAVFAAFRAFHAATSAAIPRLIALVAARVPGLLEHGSAAYRSGRPSGVLAGDAETTLWPAVHDLLSGMLEAQDGLAEASFALSEATNAVPRTILDASPIIDVPGVLHIDLSDEPNTYPNDYILLLDGGGNDTYLNNAGGTHNFPSDKSDPVAAANVDLGGNDRYMGMRAGVNGSGGLGGGYLFDAGGDDLYAPEDQGNGLGAIGTGCLIDVEGDDLYKAPGGGNGSGSIGVGTLVDGSGADRYAVDEGDFPNNGSGFNGSGALVEGGGDDEFLGAGHFANAVAFVGRAAIIDLGGADRYEAPEGNAVAGAGSALLIDLGNSDDSYLGRFGESPNNSTGGNAGITLLYDEGGNDVYGGAEIGLGTGAAGIGMLLDGAGDDGYGADGAGKQSLGSAALGGVGIVVDGGGDDIYASPGGGPVMVLEGAGYLLDRSGNDAYSGGRVFQDDQGNVLYDLGITVASMGLAFLLDLEGNDRYESAALGTAVAGCGAALLRDVSGDDVYAGGIYSNGVGVGCPAVGPDPVLLLDEEGDDTYTADAPGNGTFAGLAGGPVMLLDRGGHDYYSDADYGSCYDCTIAPKGNLGSQVDEAAPP